MFASIFVLALPLLVAATAVPPSNNVCNTGALQCCNSVQTGSAATQAISNAGIVDVLLGDVNVPVGVTCSPLSVIGLSSGACTAQPVCCENNTFNGVIALGCSPISAGL